ncbi:MAG: alpha/beta fold hydrolase [Bacteroidota bacterium]
MSLPKLLLLHGALGASPQFDELSKRLSNDFEIFILDFPGHGGSAIPDQPFSFSFFASHVISFLDKHNISRIHVFGYSMGGYAALWAARHFPGRLDKIFTLATKFEWNEDSARREAAMLDAEKIEAKVPAFAKSLAQLHEPQDWKAVVKKTAEMILQLGKIHLNEYDFKSIVNHVMITVGDKDKMVSIEESRKVSVLLPKSTLYIFPDSYHPFEKMELNKLIPVIKLFLK